MRNYRFSRPPKELRQKSVKLDNVALVPGNLLPYKSEYQQITNDLPRGGILIVLPAALTKRRAFEKTALQLKNKGHQHQIVTASAERFA